MGPAPRTRQVEQLVHDDMDPDALDASIEEAEKELTEEAKAKQKQLVRRERLDKF